MIRFADGNIVRLYPIKGYDGCVYRWQSIGRGIPHTAGIAAVRALRLLSDSRQAAVGPWRSV